MVMSRSIRVIGLTVAVATAAACGSASSGGATLGTRPATSGLRGGPVPAISCQQAMTTPAAGPVASDSVTSLIICPPRIPDRSSNRITVRRGSAVFGNLLSALSLPDRPPSRLPCPAYGDVPQIVIATTSDGSLFDLAIPVDGCSHYQAAALAALAAARASAPRAGVMQNASPPATS
jgi:hypothetical protein